MCDETGGIEEANRSVTGLKGCSNSLSVRTVVGRAVVLPGLSKV